MTPSARPLPRLVFVPGLANDGEVFDEVRLHLGHAVPAELRPIVEAARVSDVATRHTTLPEMARALLDEEGEADEGTAEAAPLLLAGHSMGGMLAQHAARQQPQRIGGLALLATTARPDTPELLRLRSEACEAFAAGRIDEVLRANVAFAFDTSVAADAPAVARYFAIVRRAGAAQLIAQNRAVMARDDNRPHLAAIDTRRCPTLVLCGEGDLLTPPEVSREIATAVAGARLQLLPACGHMLTLEAPQKVAEHLAAWLAECAALAERRLQAAGDAPRVKPR